jgi:hypothetical protein
MSAVGKAFKSIGTGLWNGMKSIGSSLVSTMTGGLVNLGSQPQQIEQEQQPQQMDQQQMAQQRQPNYGYGGGAGYGAGYGADGSGYGVGYGGGNQAGLFPRRSTKQYGGY